MFKVPCLGLPSRFARVIASRAIMLCHVVPAAVTTRTVYFRMARRFGSRNISHLYIDHS